VGKGLKQYENRTDKEKPALTFHLALDRGQRTVGAACFAEWVEYRMQGWSSTRN